MLSNTIVKWSHLQYTPIIEFYEQGSNIRGPQTNFYCFSAVLVWYTSNFEKYVGARKWTNIGIRSLRSEQTGDNEDRKEFQ